jgi:hypothetical protein
MVSNFWAEGARLRLALSFSERHWTHRRVTSLCDYLCRWLYCQLLGQSRLAPNVSNLFCRAAVWYQSIQGNVEVWGYPLD